MASTGSGPAWKTHSQAHTMTSHQRWSSRLTDSVHWRGARGEKVQDTQLTQKGKQSQTVFQQQSSLPFWVAFYRERGLPSEAPGAHTPFPAILSQPEDTRWLGAARLR